jgi:hypothetical protein
MKVSIMNMIHAAPSRPAMMTTAAGQLLYAINSVIYDNGLLYAGHW